MLLFKSLHLAPSPLQGPLKGRADGGEIPKTDEYNNGKDKRRPFQDAIRRASKAKNTREPLDTKCNSCVWVYKVVALCLLLPTYAT